MILLALVAAAATPACALPAGWAAVEARHTPYIVLGESHGTVQGPAALATLACALAARGETLLVALEQNAPDDNALSAAWALSEDSDFAVAIPRALYWQGRDDGNGSKAMLATLVALHRLKARGKAIDLVAFNGGRDEKTAALIAGAADQNPHEAAQADNIRRAAQAQRYDHVLVLVSNFHARKQERQNAGSTIQPMAMRLAPAQQISSLRLTFGPGTAWNCSLRPGVVPGPERSITAADVDCGAHPYAADPGGAGRRGIRMGDPPAETEGAYDGWWFIGPSTASPPVLPGQP